MVLLLQMLILKYFLPFKHVLYYKSIKYFLPFKSVLYNKSILSGTTVLAESNSNQTHAVIQVKHPFFKFKIVFS